LERPLNRLNSLPASEAHDNFLACCGSGEWATRMTQSRPFGNLNDLMQTAETVWWSLTAKDWYEAFSCHPKIGAKKAERRVTAIAQKWSEQEQSRVGNEADTLNALLELNQKYEEKFGYIFIVCATGKSSHEMLEILKERIGNDEQKELRIAAGEQAKITKLRLEKLLNQ
jgi:OHCU decarboxylase